MKSTTNKIFSIILTFLLLISSVSISAIADTERRIELTSPTGTINVGDYVEIPVSINNADMINGYQFKVTWDPTLLFAESSCYKKASNDPDVAESSTVNKAHISEGYIIANGASSDDEILKGHTSSYTFGTLKLKVLDAAAGKTVDVKVEVGEDTYATMGIDVIELGAPVNASFKVEGTAVTQYTVKFNDGTTDVKTVQIDENTAIGAENMPADPTKEGYTFDGWFDGETKITAETVVTGNITATAKFTVKPGVSERRIELTSPTGTINVGDYVEIPVSINNADMINGYQFKVTWDPTLLFAESSCYKKASNDPDVAESSTVNKAHISEGYIIANGASSDDEILKGHTSSYTFGTLKLKVLDAAAGKTVDVKVEVGEDTYATMGIDVIELGAPVNASFKVEGTAVTQYTVKFNDGTTDVKTVQIDENTAIGAENMPADPTKEGYTFDGWFDGETKITAETVVTGNIAATAKFTLIPPTQYAVTFKDGETTVDTVMVNKGETVTAEKMPKAPEKTGYTFKGWFIGEDEFTGDTVVNDNITVTAVYEINKYTVTFKDGENELGKADVDYNTAIGAENMPADPTKEGYTFDGWYDGETKITAETVVTGNITATAKFDVKSYQVTFDIDGTTEKVVTINYGDKIGDEMPADPVKEGYVFKGWFNGEEEITKDTEVKGSFTATAKFEEKVPENFTVTFVSDGKTVYMADILEGTTIGDANIPNDRVKDGYTFKGWFNGDDEVKADTTVTGSITVEAKFEVTPAEEIFSLGDADGSGEINGADIVLFRQKLLRRPVMVFDSSKDLYKDGEFDGNDVIRLAQYYAGLLDDSNIQITPAP